MNNLKVILEGISKQRVLVLGDLMLDSYWWGSANRISPEAPVPVLELKGESIRLGGAANVALNIVGLGAEVSLCAITGNDAEAGLVQELASQSGIGTHLITRDSSRPTTVKRRILANNQQLLRVDREVSQPISTEIETEISERIAESLDDFDCIVVSDYAKGLVTAPLVSLLVDSGRPVFVDPKGTDYRKYRGSRVITPNLKEFGNACSHHGIDGGSLVESAKSLLGEIDVRNILVTRGSEGMTLITEHGSSIHRDAVARTVFDVTGAGDTVIATLSVAISSGLDNETALELANEAAGIVVEFVGTTAVTKEILLDRIRNGQ
jgi:D-beta-D-heptose 7-phosphate kinase/D-beta-D-heptose 1-phosphate adenosyltransferase